VTWVRGAHHVLSVEHLLGELWDGKLTVLLRSARCQRGEAGHEEMETGEWDQVDSELTEIGVELTWESHTAGDATHASGDEMVEISVGWGGELQSTEADIVESFVINDHDLISVLDELMDGQGSVVWLDDGVRDLRGWEDGEGLHDTIWVFLTDLGDEKGSHTRASATTEGVADLEAL